MQTPSISWKNKGPQQSDHKTKERHKRTPEFPANLGSVRIRAEGVPAPIQFGNSRSPVPTCNAPESHDGTANAVCFPTRFHLRFAPLLTRPVASAVRLHKRSSADGMPLLRVLISVWFLASAKTLNSGYFELCSRRLSSPSISGHVQKEKARRNSSSGHSCERGIGTIVWYPDSFLPKHVYAKCLDGKSLKSRHPAFNAGRIFFLLPGSRRMVWWLCRTDRRRDCLRRVHRWLDSEPRSLLESSLERQRGTSLLVFSKLWECIVMPVATQGGRAMHGLHGLSRLA